MYNSQAFLVWLLRHERKEPIGTPSPELLNCGACFLGSVAWLSPQVSCSWSPHLHFSGHYMNRKLGFVVSLLLKLQPFCSKKRYNILAHDLLNLWLWPLLVRRDDSHVAPQLLSLLSIISGGSNPFLSCSRLWKYICKFCLSSAFPF